MAVFVLVHGGFHGGWCWQRVTPHLRAAGHEVYTPTLTGLGERAHLATPETGLDTHIRDVLGVLVCEELRDVVLVGHSMAGTVVTGVAERASERLAHLVYFDATVPRDGHGTGRVTSTATRRSAGPRGRRSRRALGATGCWRRGCGRTCSGSPRRRTPPG